MKFNIYRLIYIAAAFLGILLMLILSFKLAIRYPFTEAPYIQYRLKEIISLYLFTNTDSNALTYVLLGLNVYAYWIITSSIYLYLLNTVHTIFIKNKKFNIAATKYKTKRFINKFIAYTFKSLLFLTAFNVASPIIKKISIIHEANSTLLTLVFHIGLSVIIYKGIRKLVVTAKQKKRLFRI